MSSQKQDDRSSDSSIEDLAENIDGWDDVEDDKVTESFVSLFDGKVFDHLDAMLKYCKTAYGFDIWDLQQKHDLDFLGLVKLVNFVRKSVQVGNKTPDLSNSSAFNDDMYLLPVMESDAVLYNLEEVLTETRTVSKSHEEDLEDELAALKIAFKAYKDDVASYLGEKFEKSFNDGPKETADNGESSERAGDASYFQSYSYNAIHETMLKDKVRTDAYRDFIYDNKDIFKDKVVLDVGCGTGILSMFCARAGARQVIAVDNSDIISTAREIIRTNKLDHKILCLKGKIEEVQLPVEHVDVIVSEWMGYGLLFESMLDSVIFARDKYLAPDGLMVPSHATIRTGVLADSEIRETSMDFWQDLYGFDMTAMIGRTRDECIVKVTTSEDISGDPVTVRVLDLHRVSVSELDFQTTFALKLGDHAQRLDGFSIWFDIFFATSREVDPEALTMETAKKQKMVAFTTGPFGEDTHWAQVICLLDTSTSVEAASTIKGNLSLAKGKLDNRALSIHFKTQIADKNAIDQVWHIK